MERSAIRDLFIVIPRIPAPRAPAYNMPGHASPG